MSFTIKDLVSKLAINEDFKELPVFHLTNKYKFRQILENGALVPQDCKVFDKKIIYFFYGKSSYWEKKSQNINFAKIKPFVFIFNLNKLLEDFKTVDVYPFDSGFFHSRKTEEQISVSDYKLVIDNISDLNKYLNLIFKDFNDYLENVLSNVQIQSHLKKGNEVVYETLYEYLIKKWYLNEDLNSDSSKASYTFEIQLFNEIILKDYLEGLLVPSGWWVNLDDLKSQMNISNVHLSEYIIEENDSNSDLLKKISTAARDYIDMHYLNNKNLITLEDDF